MARYVEQVNSLLHQQKSYTWYNFAESVCVTVYRVWQVTSGDWKHIKAKNAKSVPTNVN